MATVTNLAKKTAQKLQSKGSDCNKLYVTKIKAIDFWFFYRDITGINSTVAKEDYLVEDNPEALEAINDAAIVQHTNADNIEVNTEVEISVG